MKKLLFGALVLLLMASCSRLGFNQSENDSESDDNSTELTEEKLKEEAAAKALMDSIMNIQIEEEYSEGLTAKAGKEKFVRLPESTNTKMDLPLIVDNKTCVTWEDGDYEITYSYLTEYWGEEGEEDRWYPKTVKGHPY